MQNRLKEVLKFAISGGIGALVEFAALYVLKEWLHIGAVVATPIAFLVSVLVNYLLCVRWVFEGAKDGSRRAQLGFAITSVIGLVLNTLLMAGLTAWLGEDTVLLTVLGFELKIYLVNKVIATLIVMVWNYFTKRYVLKRG